MTDGLLIKSSKRRTCFQFPALLKSFLLFVLPNDDEDIVDTI
jgi:hypothetical protein